MTIVEPGLRERKRVATKRAIEFAAISIVADKGLDRLTIDEIVHEAEVSARTFFNYFPSKEAALIGALPDLPDDASVEAFVTAGPDAAMLPGISQLLVQANERSGEDIELGRARKAVLKDYPQLFAIRMASMREFEKQFETIVRRRIALDEPVLARNDGALQRKSRLVTYVAFAAVKHAWMCWADDPKVGSLQTRLASSFGELEELCSTGTFASGGFA